MNYLKLLVIYIILSLFVLSKISCKKDTTGSSEDCSPFKGITEVDHLGNVGNIDSNDWVDSELIKSPIAYPNPAIRSCNIQFGITFEAFVQITINDKPNRIVKTIITQILPAGLHWIQFDLTTNTSDDLQNCIYRIYISATNNKGITYKTFGDIKVER